jgi:hypothetical protein
MPSCQITSKKLKTCQPTVSVCSLFDKTNEEDKTIQTNHGFISTRQYQLTLKKQNQILAKTFSTFVATVAIFYQFGAKKINLQWKKMTKKFRGNKCQQTKNDEKFKRILNLSPALDVELEE